MAIIDTDTVLNRARLAQEASAVGHALLEADFEEARFRAHLLRSQAADIGLDDVANAALRVVALLPADASRPQAGIGRAMLRLCETLEIKR